jgi:YggT family protein
VGVRFATLGLLADAVSTLQDFVAVFVGVYVLVIFVYVIASFFRLPYSFNPVLRFLYDVCEPYLRLFRRILPSLGPLDLSPLVGVIALLAAEQILVRLLELLH